MKTQTLESKLLFAQNAITNALGNDEVNAMMAELGYDQDRLNEGQALHSTANELQTTQVKEYGEQFAATDELNNVRVAANAEYMKHVKIARIALKGDRGAFESLQLNGTRKESLSGWLKQAKTFYANAIGSPDVITAVGRFGVTAKKLKAAQSLVNDVETKLSAQLKEKGEAQNSTQARDEAFDTLQGWMSDFVGIARIALETKPQYLEMLGIVEPS